MVSGFYTYTWWVQLAPNEKRGSFIKGVDQNFPPYLSLSNECIPLTKPPPIIHWKINTLTQLPLPIFFIGHSAPLTRRLKVGGIEPKSGGQFAPNLDSRLGDRSHCSWCLKII